MREDKFPIVVGASVVEMFPGIVLAESWVGSVVWADVINLADVVNSADVVSSAEVLNLAALVGSFISNRFCSYRNIVKLNVISIYKHKHLISGRSWRRTYGPIYVATLATTSRKLILDKRTTSRHFQCKMT